MLQHQSCTKSVCLDIMARVGGLYQLGKLTTEQMRSISSDIQSAMKGNGFEKLINDLREMEESLQEPDRIFSETLDEILKEVYAL